MNVMVLAPLPNSMCSFVLRIVRILKKCNLRTDKLGIWAYITSAYSMSKQDEIELLDTLAWMGVK